MSENKVNIDHLHKVHLGELSGRGCGKTTLFATYLIGLSQLEEYKGEELFVLFNWMQDSRHCLDVVEDACNEMSVRTSYRSENHIRINKTLFVFKQDIPENRVGRGMIIFGEDE